MRPVSNKASRDAWVWLACALADDPFKRQCNAMQNTSNEKRVMRSASGDGFDPEDISSVTGYGKDYLRRTYQTTLGTAPYEFKEIMWRRRNIR